MKNKTLKEILKTNKYLILCVVILFLLALGVFMFQKSYAIDSTAISTEEVKNSNKNIITTSNDDTYMYFDVELKNPLQTETYYLNTTIDMKRKWIEVQGKEVKALLEKSTDNTNYTTVKEVVLSVNDVKELTKDEQLTNTKTFYRLSLKADNSPINMTDRNANIELDIKADIAFDYDFKEESQEFKAPVDGDYKIELWGAMGNYYGANQKSYAGEGSYTAGTITLSENDTLYVYTGKNAIDSGNYAAASFNGNAGNAPGLDGDGEGTPRHYLASGGGATDVRLVSGLWNDFASLSSRIMVAGGGGGALYATLNNSEYVVCSGTGGAGGGLVSYPGGAKVSLQKEGVGATASTQTKGGTLDYCITPYQLYYKDLTPTQGTVGWRTVAQSYMTYFGRFGVGADNRDGTAVSAINSSGGGGYYGGTVGCNLLYQDESPETHARHSGGAGGSSYISGHTGSIAITSANDLTGKCSETVQTPVLNQVYDPAANYVGTTDNSCSIHYSGLKFKDTTMIDGEGYSWTNKREAKVSMPKPDGGTFVKGNDGSGAAKITAVSLGAETVMRKGSTVVITTKYVNQQGAEIASREIQQKEVGQHYTTTQKEIGGYVIETVPNNHEGDASDQDIEVIYVYKEAPLKITYKTDGHGTVNKNSEEVEKNNNPNGVTNTPSTGYKFLTIKCDKDVELNNNTTINKYTAITFDQIKQIKMTDNLTCTIFHRKDIITTYDCN